MSSYEYRPAGRNGQDAHRIRFRLDGRNRAVTFASKEEAERWQGYLDDLGADRALSLLEQKHEPERLAALVDYMGVHIETLTGITAGTRARYENVLRQHIEPYFGRTLMVDVTREQVARWVNEQERSGVLPQTVKNRYQILASALRAATSSGVIPFNPADRMKMPKDTDRVEMVFLTLDEVEVLLEEIHPHYRPLITLLAWTGVRWGEATALQVRDLSPATNSARIVRAWKHTEGRTPELGAPKSRMSRRTVAVPNHVFDALAPAVEGRAPEDFVLRTVRDHVVRSSSFHGNYWQPAVLRFQRRVGKKPRIHDLRHSWASWAIQQNAPLPVIQRQMGHESIKITVDTYGHLARSDFDPLLTLSIPSSRRALEA